MSGKIKIVFVSFILLTALYSCKDREALSWESEIFLPLVDDNVTWSSFVPDSLLVLGEGGEPARLVYKGPFEAFSADDIPVLPDTTLLNTFSMGNLLTVEIPAPEDIPFMEINSEMQITNLSENSGMYLRELILSEGTMKFSVESTVDGILNLSYALTSMTIGGEIVEIEFNVPPAVGGENGVSTVDIDLTGAVFDMTGEDGSSYNSISSFFTAMNSPLNEDGFFISNLDSLTVKLEMQDMKIEKAKGYFGDVELDFGTEVTLIDTVPVPNPILDLEGAVAKLRIENTIGADLRLNFDTLLVDGQSVIHPTLYGAHDIPRAQWIDGNLIDFTTLEIDLGESGSNIFDLMENFPEKFRMAGSAQVNPYGDISFGNDYADTDYIPELELEIEIPFRMGVDGVVLEEVYTLDPLEFPKFDGRLLIDLTSTFPVEVIADVDYVVNDAIGTVVAVNTTLEAGSSFPEMPAQALLMIPLNQAIIEPGGNVYVNLTVRTDGAQIFTGYENIRVQVRIEGTQLIEVE
ncbi:MAG: hypothetical protein P8L64_04065 [Flavobacteriales bacterium]|nr:hypothetical protein [Flavobacteriales bacterium]